MGDRLDSRVAIVTGGASGIGAATVRRFAREGARVLIADLDSEKGGALVEGLGPDRAHFEQVDVSDAGACAVLAAAAAQRFGRLDILVNNAGVGSFGETPDLPIEDWERVVAINLNAVFYACRAAIPEMRKTGGGAIVNTASISGLAGDYAFTAYNATKGAVINYTKALAIDHAKDNIRVNAICPGPIETPLFTPVKDLPGAAESWLRAVPMGRFGTPEEMANVIFFLASDEASYMTGSIVVADGGVAAATGQPNLPRLMQDAMDKMS